MKFNDITGHRFGRWTVQNRHVEPGSVTHWKCKCDCGTERIVLASNLSNGRSTNCGCVRKEMLAAKKTTHGASRKGFVTSTYVVWLGMHRRCENPSCKDYKNYGARGISVCDRWGSFENFLADMGERPPGRSIDRINNDGNYEPDNCRWATTAEQNANKRGNFQSRAA